MAKDWHDPAELAKDGRILAAFTLVLVGVAAWEFFGHIPFDLSVVTGRRRWKWPMTLYFICRITMLTHTISMAINLNAIAEVGCLQLVWVSKVSDALGTCSSSLILSLRTYAVWGHERRVGLPLLLLWFGQVGLWINTFRFSRTNWDPKRKICVVGATAPTQFLVPVFSYTMAYDFIILVLCAWSLWPDRRNDGISSLILRDGIGYFTAVFFANLLETVVAVLHLNPPMNLMFLPFALVVSTIAASTVFRNVFVAHDGWVHGSRNGVSPETGASIPQFAKPPRGTRQDMFSVRDNAYVSSSTGASGSTAPVRSGVLRTSLPYMNDTVLSGSEVKIELDRV